MNPQFNILIFDADGHAPMFRCIDELAVKKFMWQVLRAIPGAALPMNMEQWTLDEYSKELQQQQVKFQVEQVVQR